MIKFLILSVLILAVQLHAAPAYRDGEVIVKFKNAAKSLPHGFTKSRDAGFSFSKNLKVIKLHREMTVLEAVEALKKDPNVEYAEPNYIWTLDANREVIPNDPQVPYQWALKNVGKGSDVEDADIDATEAWELATGSKDIIVAVVDTGVDYTHKDLKENMWVNQAEFDGEAGVDDDGNGIVDDIHGVDFANNDGDPIDDHSHGTHCAGVIGAQGNNGLGVAGVNWNVRIMALKFLTAGGSGDTEGAISSIEYAVNNGARVISNSWGGGPFSEALKEVLEYAASKDVLVVNAAGNSNNNNDVKPHYPSSYEISHLIGVASTTSKDTRSSFSSYGLKTIQIAAPGSNIISTVLNNGYSPKSGTSMATPYVSGAAALLMSYLPELKALEVKERLIKSTDKIKSLRKNVSSAGRLNVNNALRGIYPEPGWVTIDPAWYEKHDKEFETPHPYPANYENTWEISHPGALYMRVHFSMFDVENRYDFVEIIDKDGEVVESLTGSIGEGWSEPVQGDYLKVRFKADGIVHKQGFKVDMYGVVMEIPKK